MHILVDKLVASCVIVKRWFESKDGWELGG